MKRLIHVIPCPPSRILAESLFTSGLCAAGIEVVCLDVTRLCMPDAPSHGSLEGIPWTYRELGDFKDLDAALAELDPQHDLLNVQVPLSPQFERVGRRCLQYAGVTSHFSIGEFPRPDEPGLLSRVLGLLRSPHRLGAVVARRLRRLRGETEFGIAPKVVFAAGAQAAAGWAKGTRIIPVNGYDHELMLGARSKKPQTAEFDGAIVFADQAFIGHPDYSITGLSPQDGRGYFQEMTRLFDELEQSLGQPVVIAAHPKSAYQGGEFGQRTMLKGRTSELIESARLVVAHWSTSITMAVSRSLPLLFVSTSEMTTLARRHSWARQYRLPQKLASVLGASHLSTQGPIHADRQALLRVDQASYMAYLYDYVTWPQLAETSCVPALAAAIADLKSET